MRRNADNPSTTFFWNDWDNEPGLKFCGLAAQGLWLKMLSLAARSREYGVVLVGDHPSLRQDLPNLLAQACGEVPELIGQLIDKLVTFKVASVDDKGRLFNRRMVAEAKLSDARAQAGRKGAAVTNSERQTFGKGVGKQGSKRGGKAFGKLRGRRRAISADAIDTNRDGPLASDRQNPGNHAGKSSGSSFFILSSVSKDTDAGASDDPAKQTFGECLNYLVQNGLTEKNARSQLGSWRRDFGDVAVQQAVETARSRSVSNPVPYIRTCLRSTARPTPVGRADGWEAMP